jgi:tRNA nucleotidyltransferase (CCA-adding enzyme)
LTSLTQSDVLLLAARYGGVKPDHAGALAASGASAELAELAELAESGKDTEEKLTIIGRSRASARDRGVNLSPLFHGLGGGGHPSAAAVTLRTNAPETVLAELVQAVRASVRPAATARQIMSAPVRTIRPETAIAEAQRILLRYGHSGLSVVDDHDHLVGIISRRDLDLALHHGFSHAPVKGYMTTSLKTITPDTALADMEALMVTHDIGRLPVLQDGHLVGIVTRTDVLRQVLQRQQETAGEDGNDAAPLWNLLVKTAELAASRGWQLFMVGGAVRDLLLAEANALLIPDVDLVVDGFHSSADQAAGVALARAIEQEYPQVRLQIHGRFQTAALTWHNDPTLDSLWLDIATARTEFYPYPAANPEVEASSIRQDLYRRDFTINALAIRLSEPRQGELLDFFGGLIDLQNRQIRVLHVNSFIEDPTRIYRAVRFAVRLGFELESQTEAYIRYAIASGIYSRTQIAQAHTPALQTRLKRELKYILEAPYWKIALRKLADLDALKCLHPQLVLDDTLWWQLRLTDRWLARFDATITLDHWQVLLEVILAYLPVLDRGKVATGLQLPVDSSDRLTHLAEIETAVSAQLQCGDRPSQMVQVLNRYSLPTLALVGIRCDRPQRQIIWRYLTHWSQVKPPLSGNDLRRLGYLPGKQFKQILEALLMATLDGELRNRAEAEMFVTEQFPRA